MVINPYQRVVMFVHGFSLGFPGRTAQRDVVRRVDWAVRAAFWISNSRVGVSRLHKCHEISAWQVVAWPSARVALGQFLRCGEYPPGIRVGNAETRQAPRCADAAARAAEAPSPD